LLSNEFFPLRIHHNRCRLGLHCRPHWGAYSAPPDHLAGFKGATLQQEGNGGEGKKGLGDGGREGKRGKMEEYHLGC